MFLNDQAFLWVAQETKMFTKVLEDAESLDILVKCTEALSCSGLSMACWKIPQFLEVSIARNITYIIDDIR